MAFDTPGFVPFQLRTAKKVRARIKVRKIQKGYIEKGGSAVVRRMRCCAREYEEGRLGCEDALLQMICIGIKISISVYKGYVNHRCWLSGSCSEGGTI